jgi:Leucine-rich repeat (LRR) protein
MIAKDIWNTIIGYLTLNDIKNMKLLIRMDKKTIQEMSLIRDTKIFNIFDFKYIKLSHTLNKLTVKMLKDLIGLDCSDNDTITDSKIKKMTKLQVLHCNPRITNDSLISTSLTTLHLKYNNTITNISNLTNLTHLNLYNNDKITDISTLTNLKSLKMGSNRISDISTLTKLESLDCGCNNRINNISMLTNLTELNLCHNGLISDISTLTKLRSLNCGWNNRISDISMLTNLTKLDLCHCESISDVS